MFFIRGCFYVKDFLFLIIKILFSVKDEIESLLNKEVEALKEKIK